MTNFGHRVCSLLTIGATILGAAALCSASPATAQAAKRPAEAKRGAVIAAQGTASAPACALCHAFDGAGDGSGAFPRIAAQSANYLS
ncbi:MAG: hypothetical protein WAV78_40930, partial [Xanthobacteraceae bacterium]